MLQREQCELGLLEARRVEEVMPAIPFIEDFGFLTARHWGQLM